MNFNTHTDVQGKIVSGKIENGKFRMNKLSLSTPSPPLPKVIELSERQLDSLIFELELIKSRLVSETTKPAYESEDNQ